MRVNIGHGWVDMGPGSSSGSFMHHGGGVTGHHSSLQVAVSDDPVSPDRRSSTGNLRCAICQEPTIAGRMYCSVAHAKLGWGNKA